MGQWDRGFLSQCFTCLTCLRGSSEGPVGRAELVLLVSRKFSGRSGGRAPSLSNLSQCLRGVLWGSGAGRLPARRGCLRCLACLAGGSSGVRGAASDSPPSLSHLSRGASSGLRRACLSCLTCLRGVRPLGRGLARGFTQKCRQFFRDFSMFCWLGFA